MLACRLSFLLWQAYPFVAKWLLSQSVATERTNGAQELHESNEFSDGATGAPMYIYRGLLVGWCIIAVSL